MKIALMGESPADEAAVAILGTSIEVVAAPVARAGG
jgi:hypothetical protein